MDIKQQIKIQKKWVEIGKATLEQVIEEGQPDEIIEYERNELSFYENELKMLQERLKNGG
ncbi:hypothetical protein [Methanobrevibacter sp.]|uniref:hypothetical protein n=1 Tax=Methanobrevibacter sp. TaxID=66852 RepID=UPI003864555F